MKQTQTHVRSLAGEEAVSYSLARGKSAAVTRESGEILGSGVLSGASSLLHLDRAAPGPRENTETVAKQKQLPQPAQPSLDTMRGARALKIIVCTDNDQ